VVIQAEAGKRRGTLGQRISLGAGLIGHGSPKWAHGAYRAVSPADGAFEAAVAGFRGSHRFAGFLREQLHGISTSSRPYRWTSPKRKFFFLRTLADLIAGALHNALFFPKSPRNRRSPTDSPVKTHRFFMEALSAEWKRSTRAGRAFALVLMDLDRFKFRERFFYGHLEGDLVLQRVGQILETNCRRSDVVSSLRRRRVCHSDAGNDYGARAPTGEQLRGWVSSDPLLREKNISASFGIACYPLHGFVAARTIQVADASMYLSKHQGGNAVSHRRSLRSQRSEKMEAPTFLEAYLGVTLKRLFSTGPEAFEEIYQRLRQFNRIVGGHRTGQRPACGGHGARPASTAPNSAGHGHLAGVRDRRERITTRKATRRKSPRMPQ